jgi:hypothetical protein
VKLAFLGTGLAARIHSKTMKAVAPGMERFYASRDLARAEAARATFSGAAQSRATRPPSNGPTSMPCSSRYRPRCTSSGLSRPWLTAST